LIDSDSISSIQSLEYNVHCSAKTKSDSVSRLQRDNDVPPREGAPELQSSGWRVWSVPGNELAIASSSTSHSHPYIPSPQYHQTHIIAIMKGTTFLATAMAAGTASAGVHKMPLKKVPLSEQLVSFIA
jgi:hypothetical protein